MTQNMHKNHIFSHFFSNPENQIVDVSSLPGINKLLDIYIPYIMETRALVVKV